MSILFEPISKSAIHKLVKKFLEIIKISIKPKRKIENSNRERTPLVEDSIIN